MLVGPDKRVHIVPAGRSVLLFPTIMAGPRQFLVVDIWQSLADAF